MAQTPVKKLYLHIGLHKTGTSAIQYALYHARERLKAQGFLYPESIAWYDHSHHKLTLPFWREEDCTPAFEALEDEVQTAGCPNLIISSELLPNIYQEEDRYPAFWNRLRALAEEIEVILYARRPDRLAESVFKQWCKSDDLKMAITPAAFATNATGIKLDLEKYCSVWSTTPGVTRLHLRSYELCRHTLQASFLSILGLDPALVQGFDNHKANPTLDGPQLIFRHYFNGLGLSQDHSDAVLRYVLSALPAKPKLDVFTHEQRRDLLNRYAEASRRAFQTYGDTEEAPFDDAIDMSGHPFRRPTTPEILDFLTKLSQSNKRLAAYLFDYIVKYHHGGAPYDGRGTTNRS